MPDHCTYDYAVVRVVPKVERAEFVNVGVIVSCPAKDYLDSRIELDAGRLLALDPGIDLEAVRMHLESIPLICRGGAAAGALAGLTQRERFHWLVAPRSTMIQTSPVHAGRCVEPQAALLHLLRRMVSPPATQDERTPAMLIRDETPEDRATVDALIASEFDTGTEADFVGQLRAGAEPVVSLVAEAGGAVVGHVLLAPAPLEGPEGAALMGLGCLAVLPEHQGRGIGSALLSAGLERCRALGFDGVVALGHTRFYSRFGFCPAARFGIRFRYDVPEGAFQALELAPGALEGKSGTVRYLWALRAR